MKYAEMMAAVAALMLWTGIAMAVPPGKTAEFANSRGKVTFDGKVHADKGMQCADCHSKPKLFEMKKGGEKVTMAAMNEGKSCGTCHDGKRAFSVKAASDCAKCHQTAGAGAKADAKRESPGEYVDDAVITTKVKAAVLKEPSLKLAEINVETFKGNVQLSGSVRSSVDINKAAEIAKGVKGVQSVKNDMILKGTQ